MWDNNIKNVHSTKKNYRVQLLWFYLFISNLDHKQYIPKMVSVAILYQNKCDKKDFLICSSYIQTCFLYLLKNNRKGPMPLSLLFRDIRAIGISKTL